MERRKDFLGGPEGAMCRSETAWVHPCPTRFTLFLLRWQLSMSCTFPGVSQHLPDLPPKHSPARPSRAAAKPKNHILEEIQCASVLGLCVSLDVERLPTEKTHSAGPANRDGIHWHGKSFSGHRQGHRAASIGNILLCPSSRAHPCTASTAHTTHHSGLWWA